MQVILRDIHVYAYIKMLIILKFSINLNFYTVFKVFFLLTFYHFIPNLI